MPQSPKLEASYFQANALENYSIDELINELERRGCKVTTTCVIHKGIVTEDTK